MSEFSGKTVFITGGSKGIGLAIALKFAKSGTNIVIVAKDEPNPNAPSNNALALEKIQALGSKALVIDLDVRDANGIKGSIQKTINQFGGIDILINNVSTFCFTDTLNTSAEKFDLLMSVNTRATFLFSQACLPYLKKSSNPHIINISPPLDMQAHWFKDHLAFSMSKYGMSLCTLGMAAENESKGIAINSLWPLTTIATTTIEEHFIPKVHAGSRWPTIMADAAYELAQKDSKACSGQFFLDEELLRESGVTDFNHYAVDPNVPLIEDLFIPDKYRNTNSAQIPLVKDLYK